jgi:hypothetical protein
MSKTVARPRTFQINDGIGTNDLCPITQQPIEHPVQSPRGTKYEKEALKKWVMENHRSPSTNLPMQLGDILSVKTGKPLFKRSFKDPEENIPMSMSENNIPMSMSFVPSSKTKKAVKDLSTLDMWRQIQQKIMEFFMLRNWLDEQKSSMETFNDAEIENEGIEILDALRQAKLLFNKELDRPMQAEIVAVLEQIVLLLVDTCAVRLDFSTPFSRHCDTMLSLVEDSLRLWGATTKKQVAQRQMFSRTRGRIPVHSTSHLPRMENVEAITLDIFSGKGCLADMSMEDVPGMLFARNFETQQCMWLDVLNRSRETQILVILDVRDRRVNILAYRSYFHPNLSLINHVRDTYNSWALAKHLDTRAFVKPGAEVFDFLQRTARERGLESIQNTMSVTEVSRSMVTRSDTKKILEARQKRREEFRSITARYSQSQTSRTRRASLTKHISRNRDKISWTKQLELAEKEMKVPFTVKTGFMKKTDYEARVRRDATASETRKFMLDEEYDFPDIPQMLEELVKVDAHMDPAHISMSLLELKYRYMTHFPRAVSEKDIFDSSKAKGLSAKELSGGSLTSKVFRYEDEILNLKDKVEALDNIDPISSKQMNLKSLTANFFKHVDKYEDLVKSKERIDVGLEETKKEFELLTRWNKLQNKWDEDQKADFQVKSAMLSKISQLLKKLSYIFSPKAHRQIELFEERVQIKKWKAGSECVEFKAIQDRGLRQKAQEYNDSLSCGSSKTKKIPLKTATASGLPAATASGGPTVSGKLTASEKMKKNYDHFIALYEIPSVKNGTSLSAIKKAYENGQLFLQVHQNEQNTDEYLDVHTKTSVLYSIYYAQKHDEMHEKKRKYAEIAEFGKISTQAHISIWKRAKNILDGILDDRKLFHLQHAQIVDLKQQNDEISKQFSETETKLNTLITAKNQVDVELARSVGDLVIQKADLDTLQQKFIQIDQSRDDLDKKNTQLEATVQLLRLNQDGVTQSLLSHIAKLGIEKNTMTEEIQALQEKERKILFGNVQLNAEMENLGIQLGAWKTQFEEMGQKTLDEIKFYLDARVYDSRAESYVTKLDFFIKMLDQKAEFENSKAVLEGFIRDEKQGKLAEETARLQKIQEEREQKELEQQKELLALKGQNIVTNLKQKEKEDKFQRQIEEKERETRLQQLAHEAQFVLKTKENEKKHQEELKKKEDEFQIQLLEKEKARQFVDEYYIKNEERNQNLVETLMTNEGNLKNSLEKEKQQIELLKKEIETWKMDTETIKKGDAERLSKMKKELIEKLKNLDEQKQKQKDDFKSKMKTIKNENAKKTESLNQTQKELKLMIEKKNMLEEQQKRAFELPVSNESVAFIQELVAQEQALIGNAQNVITDQQNESRVLLQAIFENLPQDIQNMQIDVNNPDDVEIANVPLQNQHPYILLKNNDEFIHIYNTTETNANFLIYFHYNNQIWKVKRSDEIDISDYAKFKLN